MSWAKCLELMLEDEKSNEESFGKYIINLSDVNAHILLNISETAVSSQQIGKK